MVEVKKRTAIVRAEEDEDEDEDDDRIREWEKGLPSVADLISLSQCLISPQLASAFSITSPSPSPSSPLSSADVALASHAALSSLRGSPHTYPDRPPSSPAPAPQLTSQPLLPVADGHGAPLVNPRTELPRNFGAILSHDRCYDEPASPLDATNSGGVSLRPYDANYSQGNFASRDAELRSYGAVFAQEYQGGFQPAGAEGDGDCAEGNAEHDGEACARANAWRPCASEGSNAAPQVNVYGEAEEAVSTPSPSENVNEEASARTLKRPRLVWTQELHKRFVDAVTHLGVQTAVPKTIMQLMNVEGLTRENVASHLQKYRQYLKSMQQGVAAEGPMASDRLFASTPLPVNLPTSGRFQPGVPAHLQDVNQVPFLPSANPVSINRGHIAGMLPGPVPPMDPYTYNVYARPVHRLPHGDMLDVRRWRLHYCDPNQHVPKK